MGFLLTNPTTSAELQRPGIALRRKAGMPVAKSRDQLIGMGDRRKAPVTVHPSYLLLRLAAAHLRHDKTA